MSPLVDLAVWLANLMIGEGHQIDIWSSGGGCEKYEEEKRGLGCCHVRCIWYCTSIKLCWSAESGSYGCCHDLGSDGFICNSGWMPCAIGDHVLFGCDPGIHDIVEPDREKVLESADCWP